MSERNIVPDTGKPLTGRKVLAITVSAFAVIIGVNLTLAYKAVSTFPGLEVANSYVASQSFDANRTAQLDLGWQMALTVEPNLLSLALTDRDGAPVIPVSLDVRIGRATESSDDQSPDLTLTGGTYRAHLALQPGKWVVWIKAEANDGTRFEKRVALFVKG